MDRTYITPGAWLEIGDDVFIGPCSSLEILDTPGFPPQPTRIGDHTWISQGFVLLSRRGVEIGKNVLVGEYVSVRDSTHGHRDLGVPVRFQAGVYGQITIEDDVWIGRGSLIQGKPAGIRIGRGAIVAANSVVVHSIPSFEVWGGVPARLIRPRGQAAASVAARANTKM
jgi:acetyltransferase-like isoleucine patch superfamily enzyme